MYITNNTSMDVRVVLLTWLVSKLIPLPISILRCLLARHMVTLNHQITSFLKTCHYSLLATLSDLLSPN